MFVQKDNHIFLRMIGIWNCCVKCIEYQMEFILMIESLYFNTFHVKLENEEIKLNFLDNLFEIKMGFGWTHLVDRDWDEIECVITNMTVVCAFCYHEYC